MFSRMAMNPRLGFRRLVAAILIWLIYLIYMGPVRRSTSHARKEDLNVTTPSPFTRKLTPEHVVNTTKISELTQKEIRQMYLMAINKNNTWNSVPKKTTPSNETVPPYVLAVFPENSTRFRHLQYSGFKDGAAFAMKYNRTIVRAPFVALEDDGQRTTTAWNKTFDSDKLRQLVPNAAFHNFRRDCGSSKIDVVYWTDRNVENYENTRQIYNDVFGIQLPSKSDLPETPEKSLNLINSKPDMKCVVFFDPEGYREKMLPNSDAKNIDEYFVRAKIMQDMVESVNNTIKKFCPTDTYLAMHWRNKTKEWCTENSEHSATCDSLKDKVAEVTRMIAETVADVMKQSKIQCVYVAHPIGSEEIIRYLNENIQAKRRIFTQDDLNIRFPDPMEDAQMKELLEEELCHGAETFIGWPKSMWSQAIIHRRDIEGKKNLYFDSLPNLAIVTSDYGLVFDIVFS